jgi:hypothetical protein
MSPLVTLEIERREAKVGCALAKVENCSMTNVRRASQSGLSKPMAGPTTSWKLRAQELVIVVTRTTEACED